MNQNTYLKQVFSSTLVATAPEKEVSAGSIETAIAGRLLECYLYDFLFSFEKMKLLTERSGFDPDCNIMLSITSSCCNMEWGPMLMH
jgi:hypothetical protein